MKYLICFFLMLPVVNAQSQTYPAPGITGFNSILHSINNKIVLIQFNNPGPLSWTVLNPDLTEISRKEIYTKKPFPLKYQIIPFQNRILIAGHVDGNIWFTPLNENGQENMNEILFTTATMWPGKSPGTAPEFYYTSSAQQKSLLTYTFSSNGNKYQLLGFIINDQLKLHYTFSISDTFNPEEDRFELMNGEQSNNFYLLHIKQQKTSTSIKYWRINTDEKLTGTGEISFNRKSLMEIRLDETGELLAITATASGKFPGGEKNGILTAVFNINNDVLVRQSQYTLDKTVLKQIRKYSLLKKSTDLYAGLHLVRTIASTADSLQLIAGLITKMNVLKMEYETLRTSPSPPYSVNYIQDTLPRAGLAAYNSPVIINEYEIPIEKQNIGLHSIILNLHSSGNSLTGNTTDSYFSPSDLINSNLNYSTLYKWIRAENTNTDFIYYIKDNSPQFGKISFAKNYTMEMTTLVSGTERKILTNYPSLILNNTLYCFSLNNETGETGLTRITF
jgi:hypothetical protein